jgi:tetratricopeptide (TPR) repeat protein
MTREKAVTEDSAETPFNAQLIVRRLAAAEGYLELQMPTYALAELSRVTDAGPFEPIAQLFLGEALQAQEKYAEAIQPLNIAAQMFPKPFNQRAFMALSNCYRHEGQDRLADEAAASAVPPDMTDGPTAVQLAVMPIFQIKTGGESRISHGHN